MISKLRFGAIKLDLIDPKTPQLRRLVMDNFISPSLKDTEADEFLGPALQGKKGDKERRLELHLTEDHQVTLATDTTQPINHSKGLLKLLNLIKDFDSSDAHTAQNQQAVHDAVCNTYQHQILDPLNQKITEIAQALARAFDYDKGHDNQKPEVQLLQAKLCFLQDDHNRAHKAFASLS